MDYSLLTFFIQAIEGFKLFDGQDVKQWVDLVAEGAEEAEEAMEVDS